MKTKGAGRDLMVTSAIAQPSAPGDAMSKDVKTL